jgi:hypothetical protein
LVISTTNKGSALTLPKTDAEPLVPFISSTDTNPKRRRFTFVTQLPPTSRNLSTTWYGQQELDRLDLSPHLRDVIDKLEHIGCDQIYLEVRNNHQRLIHGWFGVKSQEFLGDNDEPLVARMLAVVAELQTSEPQENE